MARLRANTSEIAAVQRGLIIQRVLVDGWSPAQAAAAFGVPERHVVRWVAAYRRHGMASLRREAAADNAPLRWARLRLMLARVFGGLRFGHPAPAPCVELRSGDDASFRR
jgi:Homeodomain-like domain-containing protein